MWHPHDTAALLFDCDGTLADTMPAHFQAWMVVAEQYRLTFDETRFYSLGGRPTHDILATLAREADIELDLTAAAALKESSFLDQIDCVEAVEPVIDVVNRCRGRVPMAVVTGGYRRVCEQILAHLGIADFFDTIVASEDTARHKPDPDPFLEAARRLEVAAAACVVWEDSDLGIEAARRAGMQWIDVRAFH